MGDGIWDTIKGTVAGAAPLLGSLIGGPAGGAAGTLIADALGVEDKPDAIQQALQQDPEAAAKLRQAQLEHKTELRRMKIEADTNRLTEINKTMRAEAQSDSAFRAGWRPTFGYACAIAFSLQMIGVTVILGIAVLRDPTHAGQVITSLATAIGALMPLWAIGLGVLGVQIRQRSRDKETAAGMQQPPGMLAGLAQRIAGKGSRE